MKKIAPIVGALALAASMIPATASADPAPNECSPNHCYGKITHWASAGDTFDAAGVDIWTDCLHIDTYTSDFVTSELWLFGTDAPLKWVELGYIRGSIAGGDNSNVFRGFWAEFDGDNNDGTPLLSHSMGSASASTWTNFSAYKQSNNSWNLYRNGSYQGTTIMTNMTGANALDAGDETSNKEVSAHTRHKNVQGRSKNTGSWSSANIASGGSGQTYGVWTNVNAGSALENWSLRQLCTNVTKPTRSAPTTAPVTAMAKYADYAAPSMQLMASTENAPPSRVELIKTVREFAKTNGEKNPKIKVVKAKRNEANTLLAKGKNSHLPNNDSIVITATGTFNGNSFTRPEIAPADVFAGSNALTMTFDAATGEVTDWALGKTEPDLSKLGTVETVS